MDAITLIYITPTSFFSCYDTTYVNCYYSFDLQALYLPSITFYAFSLQFIKITMYFEVRVLSES